MGTATERARLLRKSFELLAAHGDRAVLQFYAELFIRAPGLRDMFGVAMSAQRDRFFQALAAIVTRVEQPETLLPFLRQLARDHRKYGVRAEHFEPTGQALLATLGWFLGSEWTTPVQRAWVEAYQLVSEAMIEELNRAEPQSPPWWTARVVRHERRPGRIAVVRCLPDRPLPYLPGQYLTVETEYWPRVWRRFSIANAPAPDHVLELHVRAVGAGWVSNAMVGRVHPGDQLRLGPAMGQMVLDPRSARPVLCVAGGTGLAPLKAIAQQLARQRPARRLSLYFGAEREDELYDLDELRRMDVRYPWLRVVPTVSEQPSTRWRRGAVPDVVAEDGEWTDHDIYVCGPRPMVQATVNMLLSRGCSPERLWYDQD